MNMEDLKNITKEDFLELCLLCGYHFYNKTTEEFELVDMHEPNINFTCIEYTVFSKDSREKGARFSVYLSSEVNSISIWGCFKRFGYDDGVEGRSGPSKNLSIAELRYLKEKGYDIYL